MQKRYLVKCISDSFFIFAIGITNTRLYIYTLMINITDYLRYFSLTNDKEKIYHYEA